MLEFLLTTVWGKVLYTFLISMVPFIELRGAIPVAAATGLSLWIAFPVAVFGNILPVPFIILFIRRIFAWLRKTFPKLGGFVDRLEEKGRAKQQKVLDKGLFLGLFLFVAIPLPGTGAWTGALVADVHDVRFKKAFPVIFAGVVTAGLIVSFVSYGIPWLVSLFA